jgi:hypothetical protein
MGCWFLPVNMVRHSMSALRSALDIAPSSWAGTKEQALMSSTFLLVTKSSPTPMSSI